MPNFPTSLDTLTNPSAVDTLASPSHSAQHADANDILEQLEAKVGIDSSTPTAGTVLAGTGAGASQWGQVPAGALTGLFSARGDLLTRDGSSVTRLPIGAANRILKSDGTDPSWATVASMIGADLTAIGALSPSNDDFLQRKAGAWENRTVAQVLTDLAAPGTTFQPLDTDLTAIAALTSAANKVPYSTGAGTWGLANFEAAGAWTAWPSGPTPSYATPGTSSWATSVAIGRYIRIGNTVYWFCRLDTVPTNGTGSSILRVEGLPYTALNTANVNGMGATMMQGWTKASYTQITAIVGTNTTRLQFLAGGSGQAYANLTAADIPSGGNVSIIASGYYETA
jgi:hypothetical protein